jgi:hypothetical protein
VIDALGELRALQQEVATLRRALGGRREVSLRRVGSGDFLGQPAPLIARVVDATSGKPLVGAPVTFATGWGRLASPARARAGQGTISDRTDTAGVARAVLLAPTPPELHEVQQAVLEAALRSLDHEAATPAEAEEGLTTLARRYRWAGDVQLQRAIDVYVRAFRPALLDPATRPVPGGGWSYLDATVIAYAEGDGAEGVVAGSAVLTVRLKDWLAPWLARALALERAEAGLTDEVDAARRAGGDSGGLLDDVSSRVQRYLRSRRGVVGAELGRREADRVLTDLQSQPIEELSPAGRLAVRQGVGAVAGAVGGTGPGGLEGLVETRSNLRAEFNAKLEQRPKGGGVDLGALGTRLDGLEGRLTAKVDSGVFETRVAGLQSLVSESLGSLATRTEGLAAEVGALRTEATRIDAGVGELRESLGAVAAGAAAVRDELLPRLEGKLDVAAFSAFEVRVSASVAAIDALPTGLGDRLVTLEGRAEGLVGNVTTLGDSLGALEAEVRAVGPRVEALRDEALGQIAAVSGSVEAVRGQLVTVRDDLGARLDAKLDRADLPPFRKEVVASLEGLGAEVATLRAESGALGEAVRAQGTELSGVRSEIASGLQRKLDREELAAATAQIDTSLGTLARLTEQARADIVAVQTRAERIEGDLVVLRERPGDPRLRESLAVLEAETARLGTAVDGLRGAEAEIRGGLAQKVDQATLTRVEVALSTALQTKADATAVQGLSTSLAGRLANLERTGGIGSVVIRPDPFRPGP